jgi:hypothetical protein
MAKSKAKYAATIARIMVVDIQQRKIHSAAIGCQL